MNEPSKKSIFTGCDTSKMSPEYSKLLYTSVFFGIIEFTASILMFINKTMFWGTISYMISVFFQCLIVLTTLTNIST